jgi:DNA recombination protein RmuC
MLGCDMQFELLLVVIVVVLSSIGLAIYLAQKMRPSTELLEIIKLLQNSSSSDRQVLIQSLESNTKSVNQRLDQAAHLISQLQRNVGEIGEIGRGMKDLSEILNSPKIRGNLGEHILAELLGQMLPKHAFFLQHTFRSGEKVDAAIKTSAGIIPIDSKFPMENFRKFVNAKDEINKKQAHKNFESDVKKHIDSISKKYILPQEGTIDYALMYIPSESVYYEIVNSHTIFEYAASKRVLPVSPTTFYAYMRAILMSFEGQKVEEQARQVLAALRAIQKDYSKVADNLSVTSKHVTNAHNSMINVLSSFESLGGKISSTSSLSSPTTPDELK